MKTKVAQKPYRKYYDDPIRVVKGQIVAWKPKPSEWAGWVWCIDSGTQQEGWVPEKCLKVSENTAEVLQDYSAAELNAKENESFEILNEESGWYWCRNSRGEEGWLPTEIFQ